MFGFIAAKKAEHSIKTMCRVLEVSRSGFYAWAAREPSARAREDERLTRRIKELFELRRKVYGSPRIWSDLVLDDGERIGRKRVERLMRQVGWSMADHMRAELVVDALQMALARRRPDPGLIYHSDQGSQFVSLAFGQQARAAGIAQSMGSKGDCYDNAVAESFFATLKKELIHRRTWPTKAELRLEVFDYIEVFYNRQRRHSTLGQISPADFENSTLSPDGTSLAATRLASPNKIMFTNQTASALA